MRFLYHFTNRHQGVSKGAFSSNNLAFYVNDNQADVLVNRNTICKNLNIKNLQTMNQVHGKKVAIINTPQNPPTSDAIITDKVNIALTVLVADCTPLLLYDEHLHIIAAVHAGRKGAFLNIVRETIQTMQTAYGSNPKDIQAYLGPSIKQCCYEINGTVLDEALQKFPTFLKENRLDIGGILKSQLMALHITKINDNSPCTCCNNDYFSYRRDGQTGRQAGVIMLEEKNV